MLVISTDPDSGTCRPDTVVNREFPSVRGVLHVINNIREKDEVKLMTCIFLYFLYLTVMWQYKYLLNNRLVQEVCTVLAQQRTCTKSWYSTCSTTNWYKKSVQYLSWPVQRRRTRHRHREPIISGRFVSLLSIWSLVTLFRIPLGYLKMKKCYLIVDRIFTFPLVEDSFNYSKQYFLNL